jgi:hypothetical protein
MLMVVAALKEEHRLMAEALRSMAEATHAVNLAATNQLATAGVNTATGNHAIIAHAIVNIAQNTHIKDAADKYRSTINNNAAVGYRSTTV